jgi:hypothetical protein
MQHQIENLSSRLDRIALIIEACENRAMAVDGPVQPTYQHVTDEDLKAIYTLARRAV